MVLPPSVCLHQGPTDSRGFETLFPDSHVRVIRVISGYFRCQFGVYDWPKITELRSSPFHNRKNTNFFIYNVKIRIFHVSTQSLTHSAGFLFELEAENQRPTGLLCNVRGVRGASGRLFSARGALFVLQGGFRVPLGGYFRDFRDLYSFPVLFPEGNRLVLGLHFCFNALTG